jgi:hypothetical protein
LGDSINFEDPDIDSTGDSVFVSILDGVDRVVSVNHIQEDGLYIYVGNLPKINWDIIVETDGYVNFHLHNLKPLALSGATVEVKYTKTT